MKTTESGATKRRWTSMAARLFLRCAVAASAVLAIGALPAAAQGPKSGVTWRDNYSNTVNKVTKEYPDHDCNIPEAVMATRMKDKVAAQEVWAAQRGNVTDYQGSVASGKVIVVVEFGHITDRHEYVRNTANTPCPARR